MKQRTEIAMASSTSLHSSSLLLLILSFLLVLPSVFSNSVKLNHALSSDGVSSWNSSSGDFAFGFRNVEFNDKQFMPLLAIWFTKAPSQTIVWYAKQNQNPALPVGSTVSLTNDGITVYDPQGHKLWHRPESNGKGIVVSSASMQDDGNFVLLGEDGNSVWQSFEEPTDTLLPGQNLPKPIILKARQSDSSFSDGNFELNWQGDGNLILYYSPDSFHYTTTKFAPYWSSNTFNSVSRVIFDEFGHIYIKNETTVIYNVTNGIPGSKEYYYMARIDSDGVFRLYNYPKAETRSVDTCSLGWHVLQQTPEDICLAFRVGTGNVLCGFNSYCVSGREKIECYCPDRFSAFEHDNLTGCRPDFPPPSCQIGGWEQNKDLVEFKEYQNLDWPLSDYDKSTDTAMDLNMCKQKCLEDCFCAAAIFGFIDGQGYCWKKRYPLSNGRRSKSVNRTALVKTPKGHLKNGGGHSTLVLVISILLGSSVLLNFILIVSFFLVFFFLYHRKLQNPSFSATATTRCYTYKELEEATGGFKQVLGRGAFGTVYKGVLRSDTRRYVAVKKLDKVMQEGENEFKTEVNVIGQTHHRNLVRLLGYCDEREHRLLVYEYMSNGSLAGFLFGISRPHWNQRVQIALGIARGLTYLHEECSTQIIHCDIKPHNILLDELFTPRISDFGLAKLLLAEQTRAARTGLRGTFGYFAPEWFWKVSITTKVDVYSFGVMLLEIICCKSSVAFAMAGQEEVLIDWAYHCYSQGKLVKLVENDEEAKNDLKRVEKHVMVAIWCIQEDPSLRPSMKKVTQMLEEVTAVSVPPRPSMLSLPSKKSYRL